MGRWLAGVLLAILGNVAAPAAPLGGSLLVASAESGSAMGFGAKLPVMYDAAGTRDLFNPAAAVFRAPLVTGFAKAYRSGAFAALGDGTDAAQPHSAQGCLARAIYFEARSEFEDGQRAVAAVILNRVRSAHYPSTICGVVYQGAERVDHCQFSFACDGKSDVARDGRAWTLAQHIAAEMIAGGPSGQDQVLQTIATATHYHADYADPAWSRSLTRLAKIGRHIFYTQS